MSCDSPFVVAVIDEEAIITWANQIQVTGTSSIPETNAPNWQLCTPYLESCTWDICGSWEWVKATCKEKGAFGNCWLWNPAYLKCTNWKTGCKWGTSCVTVQGEEIFPAMTLSASATSVITTSASTGIIFSVEGPNPTPYECTQVIINSCDVTLSMNITGFPNYS